MEGDGGGREQNTNTALAPSVAAFRTGAHILAFVHAFTLSIPSSSWIRQYTTQSQSTSRQSVFWTFICSLGGCVDALARRTRVTRSPDARRLQVLRTSSSVGRLSSPAALSSAATSDAQVLAMLSLSPLGGTVSLVKGLSSGKLKLHLSMGIHITTLSRQYTEI